MKRVWFWLPLVAFALFFAMAAFKLMVPGNTTHASKLIGQPMPPVVLPAATQDRPGLTRANQNGARLINIFASWCVPCAAEAPMLSALAADGAVIDGIAIRDRPEALAVFLGRYGNPYRAIGADMNSRTQIALGSSGVPETFVVDARNVIRYQQIGEITQADLPKLLAELEAAK